MKNDKVPQIAAQLASVMKARRLSQGISHDTLAARSGLTRQAISMIESGRRAPSIVSCLKLAQGLGASLQELLDIAESNATASKTQPPVKR